MDWPGLAALMDKALVQALAIPTTYDPAGAAAPVTVRGIFDAAYVRVDAGEAGVSSSGPMVFYRLADLPVDPTADEPVITINGVAYTWPGSVAGTTGYVLNSTTGGVLTWNSAESLLVDKTLTRPKLLNYTESKSAPTISGNSLTLDLADGNHFAVALTANITTLTFSNVPATGQAVGVVIAFTADGTVRAITWPASVKWAGGVAPTMTGTNTKVDLITLYTFDGGTVWYGVLGGQNFC